MDITTIKNFIVVNVKPLFNLSLLWSKAKEAVKLPYAKTYIAVSFLLLVFFLIVTFPYDMLIRNKLKVLEKTVFKTVYMNELKFSIFDIIEINNLQLVTNGGSEITIKNTDIDISLLKLLIQKDVKGTIQMTGFRYSTPSSQMTFNLNGNIYIDYKTFGDIPQGGSFSFIIDNAVLKIGEFNLPENMGGLPMTLPVIRISSIKADADIANNRVNIRNIRIFGKDLNGTITGAINLSKNFMTSGLDLKVMMNANSPVLESYRDFLTKFINDSNQVVFQLRGSVMMPRIEMPQAESGAGIMPRSEHPMDKIIPVQ